MKKNKTKKMRLKLSNKKIKGGFGPERGFPACTNLSLFPIIDQNILGFRRYLNSSMDCFINAFQVFGLLDTLCANILRISSTGRMSGFTKEEIEGICILLTGLNFDFINSSSYAEFEQVITTSIPPNYGVLAGYSGGGGPSHVFIIARNSSGEIILIDPQLDYLGKYGDARHLIYAPGRNYYLLFQSPERLTPVQIRSLGFNY
jgi:hypothetical protein